MPKGNHSNHKKKYLTDEAFEWWRTHDFSHLVKRVNFQDIKITFVLIFLGLLIVLVAISLISGI